MRSCININHFETQQLSVELNLHPAIVAAKIGAWQDNNKIFNRFPTMEELSSSSVVNNNEIKPSRVVSDEELNDLITNCK